MDDANKLDFSGIVAARSGAEDVKTRRDQTPLQLAAAPRRNRGGDVFAGHTDTVDLLRRLGATD